VAVRDGTDLAQRRPAPDWRLVMRRYAILETLQLPLETLRSTLEKLREVFETQEVLIEKL
jgi:hypothetical protein